MNGTFKVLFETFSNDRKSFSSRSANDFDGILIENGEVHMT